MYTKVISVITLSALLLTACGTAKPLDYTNTLNKQTNVLPTPTTTAPTPNPQTQTRENSSQSDYTPAAISTTPALSPEGVATKSTVKTYTLADISKHASAEDCWTAIHGNVYDLTQFIPSHPGGQAIIQACGKDGTALFDNPRGNGRPHPEEAQELLPDFLVGQLKR